VIRMIIVSTIFALGLVACSTATRTAVSDTAAALASPAGQALVTMVESFTPGVSAIVANVNAGLAASGTDKQLLCGAISEANGLFDLLAPVAGIKAADQAAESATMTGVNILCNNPTTDVGSAVATLLAAYNQTAAALSSTGAAVKTASVAPAPAAP
jgi:hypothetical protein